MFAGYRLLSASLAILPTLVLADVRTIDGSASDWTGTAPVQVHATAVSGDEFIYKGESGDVRTDPGGSLGNYDITEVRVTRDATYLYLLVRLTDVNFTDDVHLCFGFDNDRSAGDVNGIGFNGDESGVIYPNAADNPEYLVSVHNSTDPATEVEFYHDAGGGTWYNNSESDNTAWISDTNDLVEVRLSLADLGMTTASTFNLSVVSYDNGITGNPSGKGFNNLEDTTVDYPTHDGLDAMGGVAGVSQNAFQRAFNSGTSLQPSTMPEIQLPALSAVEDWSSLAD